MLLAHLDQVCSIEAEVYALQHFWTRSVFVEELNKENEAKAR